MGAFSYEPITDKNRYHLIHNIHMSTLDLKARVIEELHKADEDLLQEILELISFETDKTPYKTNSAEKSYITEGQNQIKAGNWFTNEEVEKEAYQWLEK